MDLSIVIHNYNTKNFLKQCIRQIKEMDVGVSYEIIVVDSNSSDGTTQMMKEYYPEINFTAAKENLGFHKGNNTGIKKADGNYILILNTDIIFLYQNTIKKMFNFMENNPKVALVGPQLLNPDKTIQRSAMRFHKIYTPFCRRTFLSKINFGKKELGRFEMDDWDHNSSRDVDWVFGACMMVRKKAIDEVGIMGDYLFMYFGDADWAREFWRHDWSVYYLVESKIVHMHRRESADVNILKLLFSPVARSHIMDWIKYIWKWGVGSERVIL